MHFVCRNEMKKAFTQGAQEEDYSPVGTLPCATAASRTADSCAQYTSSGSGTATVWQFGWSVAAW